MNVLNNYENEVIKTIIRQLPMDVPLDTIKACVRVVYSMDKDEQIRCDNLTEIVRTIYTRTRNFDPLDC